MRPLALGVGALLLGVAVYTLSDPLSRSRNWVAVDEWERNPGRAKEKQRRYAFVASVVVAGFGLFFVAIGLFAG